MTGILESTRRALNATETVGLSPFSIRSTNTTVEIQDTVGARWTVAQATDVARAMGVGAVDVTVDRYYPNPHGRDGFCVVKGTTSDGISVSVFCGFEPPASEAAA